MTPRILSSFLASKLSRSCACRAPCRCVVLLLTPPCPLRSYFAALADGKIEQFLAEQKQSK